MLFLCYNENGPGGKTIDTDTCSGEGPVQKAALSSILKISMVQDILPLHASYWERGQNTYRLIFRKWSSFSQGAWWATYHPTEEPPPAALGASFCFRGDPTCLKVAGQVVSVTSRAGQALDFDFIERFFSKQKEYARRNACVCAER